jgi:lipopolysaccharide cholinephosphotransferase
MILRLNRGENMNNKDLKAMQDVEFEMLIEFDRICKNNSIEYFLDAGTLLGAALYKDFVPWDDDIDVGMLREDYEKFLCIAQEKLSSRYFLQTRFTDSKYLGSYAKIRKNNTSCVEWGDRNIAMHHGISMDINPFDFTSSKNYKTQQIKWKLWHKMFALRIYPETTKNASFIKKLFRKIIHISLQIIPSEFLYKKLDLIKIDKNNDDLLIANFHSVNVLTALPLKEIRPFGTLVFRDKLFPVLRCWENYLQLKYGNWRQIPPKSEQITHEIEIFDLHRSVH